VENGLGIWHSLIAQRLAQALARRFPSARGAAGGSIPSCSCQSLMNLPAAEQPGPEFPAPFDLKALGQATALRPLKPSRASCPIHRSEWKVNFAQVIEKTPKDKPSEGCA
jgi:hypothetical protein